MEENLIDWHKDGNYIDYEDGKHSIQENQEVETHKVTITPERLRELIYENHEDYLQLKLQKKVEIITIYAEFESDSDLLEFLIFMEEE